MIKYILVTSFLVAAFCSKAHDFVSIKTNYICRITLKSDTAFSIKSINVKKAQKIILQNIGNSRFVIVDVRSANEYKGGHISDAINLDFKSLTFLEDLDKLDKSKTYLVYCTAGYRSKRTSLLMIEKKFTSIYNMKGGMMKWKAKNLPVEEPKQ